MKVKVQHSFTNIKIASFNCRGLNDQNKRSLVFEHFMNTDLTIICLQETKLKPEKEFLYTQEWKKGPAFFNSISGGKSGTAILFNTWQIEIKKYLIDQIGRVIALDVDIGGTVLHIINTYFPNVDKDQYSFICCLQPFFYSPFPIVWAGDHNISIDNMLDRFPRRQGCDKFGKNIVEIIDNFGLVDTARYLYPTKNDIFTFVQGNVASRIDKIIVGNDFMVKQFWHEVNIHSDHVIIMAHLQLDQNIEKGHGVWKNNVSIYQNEIFKDEFKILWDNWKDSLQTSCPLTFWVSVKKKIKHFLMDIGKLISLGKKSHRIHQYEKLMKIFGHNNQNVNIQNYMKEKKGVG